jgi:5-methylthioadenosine/S-adenosylhomocysteine deaminase
VLNGVTTTIEAGTVAHPSRVADALRRVGMRARIGTWGWDVDDAPYAAPADEVLDRQRAVLDAHPAGAVVEGGATLIGHDLMSDELLAGASELARERGAGLTFHISPHGGDPASYLERTGARPIVHFDRLGALGPHVLLAHAVHLDQAEIELVAESRTAIASCPWAYLRLAQGFTANHRHDWFLANGGRLALGGDAENAGDAIDLVRVAALFVGLVRDRAEDPMSVTSADGFAPAPQFTPPATDPVRQLVWASDGRTVTDVLIDGRVVVRDRACVTVDLAPLRSEAAARQRFMLDQVGGHP